MCRDLDWVQGINYDLNTLSRASEPKKERYSQVISRQDLIKKCYVRGRKQAKRGEEGYLYKERARQSPGKESDTTQDVLALLLSTGSSLQR